MILKLIYDTRPADVGQIGILNAIWMQFDGGFWSVVLLQVLPVVLLVASVAVFGYIAWTLVRPVVQNAHMRAGVALKALRLMLVAFTAILALMSLRSVYDVFATSLSYGEPQTWLTLPFYNNFFLIVVLIWIQTGFAMVILSAALRGIPEETAEAAVIDGANPFQIFFQIKVPQIMPTIVVVWTTITLTVLMVFDIVFALTKGQWETQVLANYMYDKLFRANDWGVGSASAIVITLLVTPNLVWNVYNARKKMR